MVASPKSMHDIPLDFRAPPPSPVASGRRSSVTNDEVLTEFLEQSLRVPDLVLPDKIFPRQKFPETPQKVDLQLLTAKESCSVSKFSDSLARTGCFQLMNHGIPSEVMELAKAAAAGIFKVPPEKKATMVKKPEKPYGFEEVHGEESELTEEFVWCRDEGLMSEMAGIWSAGYSNFSEKMEALMSDVEKVAEKILQVLLENSLSKSTHVMNEAKLHDQEGLVGSVCYVYNHRYDVPAEKWETSLKHDVIRMLIKGIDYPHALCFHLCDGSSEFHVYSKKGWLSFCPEKGSLVVTVGDQVQTLSGGQYKHVIGKPIFQIGGEDCISMSFLYSSPSNINISRPNGEKTITLSQQVIIAIILTLVYRFLVFVYNI